MPKLPKFEDYKAPWEEKGEDPDPDKIKRHYYNLLSDKEKQEAKLETVTTERDEFKAKVDEHETKDMSEVDRLKRENEELKSRPAEPDGQSQLENARLRLALKHGLSEKQAGRLTGTTAEELEADVPELLADLGKGPGDDSGDDDVSPFQTFRTGNDHGEKTEDNDPSKFRDYF